MIMTFSRALAKPLIETVSRADGKGFFQVRIGTITTVITIVVLSLGDGTYVTTQDYAIKAGWQAGPYQVRDWAYEIPGTALDEALSTYRFYYMAAVRRGYEPKSSWLVPLTQPLTVNGEDHSS